jgi:hypothetical protein
MTFFNILSSSLLLVHEIRRSRNIRLLYKYHASDSCSFNLRSYQSTLKQLFQEFDASDPDSQLTSVTTRIMQALQNNLDGKSKQYKDPALTQLFLMNNIHYIVRSVRRFVLYYFCILYKRR